MASPVFSNGFLYNYCYFFAFSSVLPYLSALTQLVLVLA